MLNNPHTNNLTPCQTLKSKIPGFILEVPIYLHQHGNFHISRNAVFHVLLNWVANVAV